MPSTLRIGSPLKRVLQIPRPVPCRCVSSSSTPSTSSTISDSGVPASSEAQPSTTNASPSSRVASDPRYAHFRAQILAMARGDQPVDEQVIKSIRAWYGARRISAQPIPHLPMGLDMYTRVTSPLRRYWDLVTCWQIDGQLQWEAEQRRLRDRTKDEIPAQDESDPEAAVLLDQADPSTVPTSATSSTPGAIDDIEDRDHTEKDPSGRDQYLLFPRETLEHVIRLGEHHDREITRFNSSHRKHWRVQAVARALHAQNMSSNGNSSAEPSEPIVMPDLQRLTATMTHMRGKRRGCMLHELRLMADTSDTVGEDGHEVIRGDTWEVGVDKVWLGSKRVVVRCKKLLAPGQRTQPTVRPSQGGDEEADGLPGESK